MPTNFLAVWYNHCTMTTSLKPRLTVIGGGLAGCEAAWQAAELGVQVTLCEMRPGLSTGVHTSANLAELVCSNSLGSNAPDRASGLLKQELRWYNSLLVRVAEESALPAGQSLAVDRTVFSQRITEAILNHPNIQLVRQEIPAIPQTPVIIASGPLTSPALSQSIQNFTGHEHLIFYDAIAPVVEADSIDMQIAYRANRYRIQEQEPGDYINCPFTREEYETFYQALITAETIPLREFETNMKDGVKAGYGTFFEACLPVEELARRGPDTLSYGPMRPVGLRDPRTGWRCHAVIQLRQENLAASLYNLVGFQTNLTFSEQRRVFHLIPGLQNAEFTRFGQMHRNTFIASPLLLHPSLQSISRPDLFFAGQITGVEGYMGNIATGLLAGLNAARFLRGQEPLSMPLNTMLGALCFGITHSNLATFQPIKANFGLVSAFSRPGVSRRERHKMYAERSRSAAADFLNQYPDWLPHPFRKPELEFS
jgi:methylenetetrahydrofolate--tRNA-(uracil-5-)-methyltransferase